MRSALALFLVLFAAYALTIGLDSTPGARVTAIEAHQLMTAESIVADGDLDLLNQYRGEAYQEFGLQRLRPSAGLNRNGQLLEPQGVGFPLLIAPAYALGAITGVKLFLAALMALAMTLAAILARRLVPDPWAWRAALIAGLSPPALGASTAIAPEAAGAALLAGGAILALQVRDRPLPQWSVSCAALVAMLPWLAAKFFAPTAVIALALARWLRHRGRSVSGWVAVEIILTSAIVYVTINDRLFSGFTPLEAGLPEGGGPTGASGVAEHLARADRLVGLWLDRDAGLLVWAPFFGLAFAGAWALWRSRRDRLSVLVGTRVDVEVAAQLYLLIAGTVIATAVFAGPYLGGPWFPGHELVPALPFAAGLAAWGLRRFPKTGIALSGLTLLASAWLLIGALLDDAAALRPPRGDLPWGGLQDLVLPSFSTGGTGTVALIAAAAVAATAGAVYEWVGWRSART
ncbi:MAG TPA: hypothetical protein VNT22_03840 [Baekduia sp.]|nr:hypothetical protein [Baekduia sp.]